MIAGWRMAKALAILVILGVFFGDTRGTRMGAQEIPAFVPFPQKLVFSGVKPGEERTTEFSLALQTGDTSWALFVALKSQETIPQGVLLLRAPGEKNPLPLSPTPILILQGTQPAPHGVTVGGFTLTFAPSWAMEAGEYTANLVFFYQRTGGQPMPLPQSLTLVLAVPPAFQVEMQEAQKDIALEVSGPPGLYSLTPALSLSARANVTPWTLLLSTRGLTGEQGGHIPPERVFVKLGKSLVSFQNPVVVRTARAGETVTLANLLLFVETRVEDPPGQYRGEIAMACSFRSKGGVQ
ncbi:hypothetical protein ACP6EK_02535 [Candidatus Caldatribacterium sp. SIUC1]|uniref:hypothetical protein n=1 Tax=Candidatus Caldatribacterium sp. SIUC1 TaxID=3418365 RepID=UPI003F6913B4